MQTPIAFAVALFCCLPPATGQTCGADTLGVARTVEIDASAGPRFPAPNEDRLLADGEVVLTFDDGPLRANTRPVLEALAQQCTRATFFLVGTMALADPETVVDYARRGHTVGSHTWSHRNLAKLSPLKARAEMELGLSAVHLAMGAPIAPFFRFPYLRDSPAMIAHLKERHFATFDIDIDSRDFRTRDGMSVHRLVMAELARRKSGIILFHDIQPSTARALPGILADLKAKGYRIVHFLPKAEATTLPEFDHIAEELFEKRHRTASDDGTGRRLALPAPEPGPHPHATAAAARARDDWSTTIWH